MDDKINLVEVRVEDLRMLVFSSLEEYDGARQFFQESDELKDLTCFSFAHSLLVPKEAIPLLLKNGLKCKILKPITTDMSRRLTKEDFTPRQADLLRQRKAYLRIVLGLVVFLVELEDQLPDHLFSK